MAESLAVKYRPHVFEDVTSQSSIVKILKKQLETQQFKNAYLFCGPSGCGKTTTARIFANEINNHIGEPIEIDAASNNSVDNIRRINEEAKLRSITSKYKIYILDECFTGDTLISTPVGKIPIKYLKSGDYIYTLKGISRISKVNKFSTDIDNIVTITLSNDTKINVTKNHYIFTTEGWIKACDLRQGDIIIEDKDLSDMWETLQYEEQDLQQSLWTSSGMEVEEDKDLCSSQIFAVPQLYTNFDNSCCVIKDLSTKTLQYYFYAVNDSDKESLQREYEESFTRNSTASDRWRLQYGTARTIGDIGRCLEDSLQSRGNNREKFHLCVSVRPCLSYNESGSRGGWQFIEEERQSIQHFLEKGESKKTRVEAVQVYSTTVTTATSRDTVHIRDVYDLTIDGDSPTYFANGILVHNCHSLSSQSWQALLKTIEEPPAYTIFIFCTTESNKVPDTISNRCMRFNFTRISSEHIKDRLRYICESEKFTNYEDSIDYISKTCKGQMRDAISCLEKVSAYSSNISIDNTLYALGSYSYSTFFDLINAIIDGNEGVVLQIINNFYTSGGDLKQFVEQFLTFCMDAMKYSIFNSCDMTQIPITMEEQLKRITNFQNASSYYSYITDNLLELKFLVDKDTNPKNTIEIKLLKLARCK